MNECPPTRWPLLVKAYAGSVLFLACMGALVSASCGVCLGVGVRAYWWTVER